MSRPLTPRQQECAALIGRGLRYKVVAVAMQISENGVKRHIKAIVTKVGNPDNLDPRDVVFLWWRHQLWQREHTHPPERAA